MNQEKLRELRDHLAAGRDGKHFLAVWEAGRLLEALLEWPSPLVEDSASARRNDILRLIRVENQVASLWEVSKPLLSKAPLPDVGRSGWVPDKERLEIIAQRLAQLIAQHEVSPREVLHELQRVVVMVQSGGGAPDTGLSGLDQTRLDHIATTLEGLNTPTLPVVTQGILHALMNVVGVLRSGGAKAEHPLLMLSSAQEERLTALEEKMEASRTYQSQLDVGLRALEGRLARLAAVARKWQPASWPKLSIFADLFDALLAPPDVGHQHEWVTGAEIEAALAPDVTRGATPCPVCLSSVCSGDPRWCEKEALYWRERQRPKEGT